MQPDTSSQPDPGDLALNLALEDEVYLRIQANLQRLAEDKDTQALKLLDALSHALRAADTAQPPLFVLEDSTQREALVRYIRDDVVANGNYMVSTYMTEIVRYVLKGILSE